MPQSKNRLLRIANFSAKHSNVTTIWAWCRHHGHKFIRIEWMKKVPGINTLIYVHADDVIDWEDANE